MQGKNKTRDKKCESEMRIKRELKDIILNPPKGSLHTCLLLIYIHIRVQSNTIRKKSISMAGFT